MKIQCSCGTKYSFDITPEMAKTPIRFVCQTCGQDSSEFVNELIRREIASGTSVAPPPAPVPTAAPPPAHPSGTGRVRIQSSHPTAPSTGDTTSLEVCAKHPGQRIAHHCLICQKPMCLKCMELFGYVCSPFCSGKAETEGIHIPVYAGKKSVVEARQWRVVGLVSGALGLVIAALLGFWFWYAWFGSKPKPIFAVRFEEPAESGQSSLCGTNQIVFLHGSTLARYDLKTQKQIWSSQLLDSNQIANEVAHMLKNMQDSRERLMQQHPDADVDALFRIPSAAELTERVAAAEAASLQLHIHGQNLWVASSHNLARYDFDNGRLEQELPLAFGSAGLVSRADELLTLGARQSGQFVISHINLANGESRVETLGEPTKTALVPTAGNKSRKGPGSRSQELAGLPNVPGADAGKPLDPAKTAEQVQNLSGPARIALPAILASALHQERIMTELDGPKRRNLSDTNLIIPVDHYSLIPSAFGYLQFSERLLEERLLTRKAMKEPSGKSALESGDLNVTKTAEVANEFFNEMQRERGGDTVVEDESRYEVTVRRLDLKTAAEWKGEVIGPPSFLPLKTVSVVTAGKMLVVLDKTNKRLWQTSLNYKLAGGPGAFGEDAAPYGEGPCAERGDALYVFDEAVLTAFDLQTGNVRWRLPCVGTEGLFFDNQGMMYVNTTTASPERIKYSRQIDVTQKSSSVVLKVDPATGRTLWTAREGGFISYVSGKYIYMVDAYQAPEHTGPGPGRVITGMETPSHVTIRRINPRTGHMMWELYQPRAPLDAKFDANSILLVFKKEVQVLRFVSF